MTPEASLSATSIADGGSNDAPPQESKKSMLSLLKADYHKTLRKAAIMHRHHAPTSTPSTVAPAGRPRASGSALSTGYRRPTTSASRRSGCDVAQKLVLSPLGHGAEPAGRTRLAQKLGSSHTGARTLD